MIVDASALVAMMTDEDDARSLAGRLARYAGPRFATPVAVFETAVAVARLLGLTVDQGLDETERFLNTMGIEVIPLPAEAGPLAVHAFARFGKGQGHPARLNMGDCLTYGVARWLALPLLFKGDDFAQTDIAGL
jgi:ribonuclease VapC